MPASNSTACCRAILAAVAVSAATATQINAAPASFAKSLPTLCTSLQKQGWIAPLDILNPKQRMPAETSIPGILYMCNVEKKLAGNGDGHAPELGVLITGSRDESSLIFSANVWCEQDRVATLAALTEQVQGGLQAMSIQTPKEIVDAIHLGQLRGVDSHGLTFVAQPIQGDPDACRKVGRDQLGAVLMKVDVSVRPTAGND